MVNGSVFDNPAALSGILTGVSFVGGLATGLSLADAPFPQPGADVKDVQKFFQGDAGAERINVTGQLLSAASLAVFSRSVAQLTGRTGSGSKMLKAAAIAGGALASTSLAASATAAAALTHRVPVVTRTRRNHCTVSCSPQEGQCTAAAWRYSSVRSVWPGCGPQRYPVCWRSPPWPQPASTLWPPRCSPYQRRRW
jgi:hypothetical protein